VDDGNFNDTWEKRSDAQELMKISCVALWSPSSRARPERDIGLIGSSFRGLYHGRDDIGAIAAGMVLFGIMNSVVGAYYIGFQTGMRLSDPLTYDMTKLIMMSFVLIIGLYVLSKRAVPEGLALILSGTGTVVFPAAAPLGGGDIAPLDILIGLCSCSSPRRRSRSGDGLLALGTGMMAFGSIAYPPVGDLSAGRAAAACMLSGIMSLLYGRSAWYSVISDKKKYDPQDDYVVSAADAAVSTGDSGAWRSASCWA
jgi:hypothetical protein